MLQLCGFYKFKQMLHTGGRQRCRGPGFPRGWGRAWARVKALPTDSQSQGAGAPGARGQGQAAPAGEECTAAGDQPCSERTGLSSHERQRCWNLSPARPQADLKSRGDSLQALWRPGSLALPAHRVELFPPHSTPNAFCPLHYQSWLARMTIYHKVASLERISTSPNKVSSFCSLTHSHHYLITTVSSYRILLESWFQRCCVQLPTKK